MNSTEAFDYLERILIYLYENDPRNASARRVVFGAMRRVADTIPLQAIEALAEPAPPRMMEVIEKARGFVPC